MAAFDWDDESTTEDSAFELLDPGEHDFVVVNFKRDQYNGGAKIPPCPMAVYTLDFDGVRVDERFYLDDSVKWRITQFFKAIKLIDPDTPSGSAIRWPWDNAIGCKGRAETRIREYEYNGETRKTNDIAKFIVPKKSATADFGTL